MRCPGLQGVPRELFSESPEDVKERYGPREFSVGESNAFSLAIDVL